MNRKNKIKAAVLGASGFVGLQLLRLLHKHPFFELTAIFGSEASLGKKLSEVNINRFVPESFDRDEFEGLKNFVLKKFNWQYLKEAGVEVIFSALPAEISGPIESGLREKGFAVFSNSAAHRLEDDVPILIPEVNPEHLEIIKTQQKKYGGFIVASSNCCVAGLVLSLKPLIGWGIKKVVVTPFQSISGASRESLAAADIMNNLIPFIGSEEEKISKETVKILGHLLENKIHPASLSISAACVRVPVSLGHLLAVEVELKTASDIDEITKSFHQSSALYHLDLPTAPHSPIILRPEPDRPQPVFDAWAGEPGRARGMAISLGRIRLQNSSLRYSFL